MPEAAWRGGLDLAGCLPHRYDAGSEGVGRALARQPRPDGIAQRDQPGMFGGQRRIGGAPSLDIRRPRGVEFAVERGVEEKLQLFRMALGHGRLPSLSTSCARARASLDITVPCGAPIAAAISR